MINLVLNTLPQSLELKDIWNYHHFLILQSMHQTLVRIDENGDIVGDLALKWNISNSGKTYHFTLRKGCLVENEEIKARDVIASLRYHLNPSNKSVIKKYLDEYLDLSKGTYGFEILNENELKIHLHSPYDPFISVLALPGFSIFKENGKLGSGSGPMVIEKINFDEGFIQLKKNDTYCGPNLKTNSLKIWDFNKINFNEVSLKKDFDVFLGNGIIQKFPKIRDYGFEITKSKSVSFLHFFPNTKRPYFNNDEFRKHFADVFQSILASNQLTEYYQYIEKIQTLMPKGVMLPEYYNRKAVEINLDFFKKKYYNHLTKKLKIVLSTSYFTEKFVSSITKLLKEAGINSEITLVQGSEIMNILNSRDYDLMTMGYVGNYPDPDGLLNPFYFSGNFKYVNEDTTDLEEEIRAIKNLEDPKMRLSKYSDSLSKFEARNLVFPGYQLLIPFIHNKKVSIPDTTYRYEGEIWNIFWEK